MSQHAGGRSGRKSGGVRYSALVRCQSALIIGDGESRRNSWLGHIWPVQADTGELASKLVAEKFKGFEGVARLFLGVWSINV